MKTAEESKRLSTHTVNKSSSQNLKVCNFIFYRKCVPSVNVYEDAYVFLQNVFFLRTVVNRYILNQHKFLYSYIRNYCFTPKLHISKFLGFGNRQIQYKDYIGSFYGLIGIFLGRCSRIFLYSVCFFVRGFLNFIHYLSTC